MSNLKLLLIVFASFLIFVSNARSDELASSHAKTVKRFVAAFNAHDSKAMATFVADDVEWLSITDKQIGVDASGKVNLIASMNAYFISCPSCRSELSNMIASTNRVSAIEVASWQGKSGVKSQTAISVYEFSNGLITRVYYFPAEK